jgi:hypothetical protein
MLVSSVQRKNYKIHSATMSLSTRMIEQVSLGPKAA